MTSHHPNARAHQSKDFWILLVLVCIFCSAIVLGFYVHQKQLDYQAAKATKDAAAAVVYQLAWEWPKHGP